MTDVKTAESLIIILRAMHDGYCPSCGLLAWARRPIPFLEVADTWAEDPFPIRADGYSCPKCNFRITAQEVKAIIADSHQIYARHMSVFEAWRKGRESSVVEPGEGYRLIDQNVDSPQPTDEFYLPDAGWVVRGNALAYSPTFTYRRKTGAAYHPVRVPWFDWKGNKTRPAPPYRDLRPRE